MVGNGLIRQSSSGKDGGIAYKDRAEAQAPSTMKNNKA